VSDNYQMPGLCTTKNLDKSIADD